ncbi:MAG: 8-oxo-dGTP diphosphatase [Desulforhopalus sp.]|jgi:8-oxo-dGTP diphosphatase
MITVTASILVHEGKVLIAKRSATDKLPNKWEFPGGKLEENESHRECLQRELEEELGIVTSIGAYLGYSDYEYDHITIRLKFYRTKWVKGTLNPVVHDEIAFVGIEELGNYDFAPADIPFVHKIIGGEIEL